MSGYRECIKCGFPGVDEEFKRDYKYKDRLVYTNTCLLCVRKFNAEFRQQNRELYNDRARLRRNERKLRAIEYKGGKCAHCSGIFHQAAFDFHHLDSTEKDKDPGLMMSHSDESLFAELDKCILLCANCHRIHHFKEGYA